MNGTLSSHDFPPHWLIRLCRFLWRRLHGWWAIGLSIFLNIVAALLVSPISPFTGAAQLWIFKYKSELIISLLILLCFTLFVGFISKFETTPSRAAQITYYLRQMILEHKQLRASGIPELFFPPTIKLEDVFISQEFVNERTPVGIDYPLSEEEIPVWQHIFTRLKKRLTDA